MAHGTIYDVLAALPPREQRFWGLQGRPCDELDALLRRGSPDHFCGATGRERQAMSRYVFHFRYPGETAARLFHYLPVETDLREGCGAWQSDSTAKFRFVDKGFKAYLARILAWLEHGWRQDALIAAGSLCHFLQDQTAFFHSLEGEEGCAPWLLDELFEVPAGRTGTSVSCLHERTPTLDMSDYAPCLLGTTPEECRFHLYQLYRRAKSVNRHRLVALVQAACSGDAVREEEIRRAIGRTTAELTADLFHTLHALAVSRFPSAEAKRLAVVDVSILKPINYPRHLSPPYRFNAMVPGRALDHAQRPRLLRLNVQSGGRVQERTFRSGIGMGCHKDVIVTYAIPAGVYRRFQACFGLHSRLGKEGAVRFELKLGSRTRVAAVLTGAAPAVSIDLGLREGGLLTFRTRSMGAWNLAANNLVLGEPRLLK